MRLRLGMIGVGGLGHLQSKTFAGLEGVSLVGAADVSADARELFTDTFGAPAYEHHRELLVEHADELDAVAIVTPHTIHFDQAMACLERDLHVIIEKPMVTDVGHAIELVDTAADRDLTLQVGYQRRFHPGFREVRRIVEDGRIGSLHAVNAHLGQDWIDAQRDTWRTDPDLSGGGQLYDTGSHLLDALLWTTGAEPVSVAAQIEYAKPGIDVDSALSIRLDRSGQPITAGVTISGEGIDVSPTEGYVIWGSEGRITYADDRLEVAEKGAATYETEITEGTTFQDLNRRKLENFIASIEGTAEPAVPGEVGLQVTALTEAAYRAAERGSTVSVQSVLDQALASPE